MSHLIVYFSGVTGYTHRLVGKLADEAVRIPLTTKAHIEVHEPYVLFCPTYGGGKEGRARHVPIQVIKFLNDPENRRWIRGVVGTGNKNFGLDYCAAADVVATKCQVPVLDRVELFGTDEDVARIKERLEQFYVRQT